PRPLPSGEGGPKGRVRGVAFWKRTLTLALARRPFPLGEGNHPNIEGGVMLKRTLPIFALLAAVTRLQAATPCESLTTLSLSNTTIALAETVAAGKFSAPGGRGGNAAYANLPAFCRIAATLKPSSDSDIKIEVWMPTAGWNSKLLAVGNGAWAGSISYT